jgi:aldehyde reductase
MQAVKLLRSGRPVPILGLGTYKAMPKETSAAVDCALTVGYRHIDGAAVYNNEGPIGEALQHHLKRGNLKRKEVFVTSKLPAFSFHSEKTMRQEMEKSLDLLQLTYVDMYLVHLPWGISIREDGLRIPDPDGDIRTVWRMMETFHHEGKAKAIGLSNFSIRLMDKILPQAKVMPENLQLECHPYLQQKNLRNYCAEKNMVVTAYAPLGSPGRDARYLSGNLPNIMQEEAVLMVAKETGFTPAQVLIAFLLHQDMVPLPKSTKPQRIEENFGALKCKLSLSQMKQLAALECGVKYFTFKYAEGHPEFVPGEEY